MPVCWMERTAVSRPEPGPLTWTSARFRPCSMAARPAFSAASCAANGVLLRLPLYPTAPDDAQAMTLPSVSVIETIVLLNELLMCTTPVLTFLRSRLRGRRVGGWLGHYFLTAFFLLATVRFGPLRVRALVWVRWPRTGRPLR